MARESFLAFLREAFVAGQAARGPLLVCARDVDPALYYVTIDSVLAQMRSTGDVNPGHYSRTIAQAHGLTLSCPEVYMGLHDALAVAIQGGIQGDLAGVNTASNCS